MGIMVTVEDDASCSGSEVENWMTSEKTGRVEPRDAVEDAADASGVTVGDSAGDGSCGVREQVCWAGE